ncbi:uncharacterized protein K02A2.6-like [Ornithodoros turicata]|uniref:uncharacterized protein K02A2.6-like n=1 Tax=Ornithodoros turicata TaxID=34597 RepID=UPI0031391B73
MATPVTTTSYKIAPPDSFSFKPNEWPAWKRRFLRFLSASGLQGQKETNLVDTLVYVMGQQAEDILQTFKLKAEESTNITKVLEKFEEYFVRRRNVIYERALFNTRTQREAESVENFVTALHVLSETCDYGELKEDLIRDRLVVGLLDRKPSEKLQLDPELNLHKALVTARQHEAVRKQQAHLRPSPEKDGNIDRIIKHPGGNRSTTKKHHQKASESSENSRSKTCRWCGRDPHPRQQCPAKTAICNKCKKKGHFALVCRSSSTVHAIEAQQDVGFVGIAGGDSSTRWDISVLLNGRPHFFKIDTGADETVISYETFCQHRKPGITLTTPKRQLHGPDGKPLQIEGTVDCDLELNGKTAKQVIYVVKGLTKSLLGKPAIEKFCLFPQVNNVASTPRVGGTETVHLCNPRKDFPQLFKGLGNFKEEYTLALKQDAKPYAVVSPRRVPLPLFKKTREELERMRKLGVISPVDEATEWCAPMVVVPKPSGNIRICVDLSELNRHVHREWHPIPSVEQTLGQLSGAKIFSRLDANSGFWQIPLNENSRLLTTFITPFGRFCFNRLPFGISSAPEHFQKRMARILEGLEGVLCHMDDVLIYGGTEEEHSQRLRKVLQRLDDAQLTLNSENVRNWSPPWSRSCTVASS